MYMRTDGWPCTPAAPKRFSPMTGRAKEAMTMRRTPVDTRGKSISSLSLASTEALAFTRSQLREMRSNMALFLPVVNPDPDVSRILQQRPEICRAYHYCLLGEKNEPYRIHRPHACPCRARVRRRGPAHRALGRHAPGRRRGAGLRAQRDRCPGLRLQDEAERRLCVCLDVRAARRGAHGKR